MERGDLTSMLEPFGVTDGTLVRFDTPLGPEHVAHLDLHPQGTPPRSSASMPAPVDAVVEMGGRPILYVKRAPCPEQDKLRVLLAQRGAADYLAIVEPGQLTVLPLLSRGESAKKGRPVKAGDDNARGFVPGLAAGTIKPFGKRAARALTAGLFKLLRDSTRALAAAGVLPRDALALVGRALFFRFLMDRNIVTEDDRGQVAPNASSLEDAMSAPEHILSTSRWLDDTFNGHLLTIKLESVLASERRRKAICGQLARILHRTEAGGQLRFEWDRLDFGHIPVGLLSEIYESWSHDYGKERAKRDSVWYTPTLIANFMVSEALASLDRPHAARVLDPAAGGGVFLVAAFRALFAALWKKEQRRPNREAVREILYKQLAGFEVNRAALRLTALALYLTALELDPEPGRGNHVKFEDLCELRVLRDVSGRPVAEEDEDDEAMDGGPPPIGSLAEDCCEDLRDQFDVVIGNPPWTGWAARGKNEEEKKNHRRAIEEQKRLVEATVTAIVRERLREPEAAFEMIQNEPDLPMLWCATRWAKPDGAGILALAMHAHVLFRQTAEGKKARDAIFRGLAVTGVLNGSALRETKVWPQHKAPFALLFARNRSSDEGSAFRYLCPVLDSDLNTEGYLRLDASARHPVRAADARSQPWLLKALFRGGSMDVPIIERILGERTFGSHKMRALGDWWPEDFASLGYIGGKTSRQKRCPELHGREELVDHDAVGVDVPASARRPFRRRTATEPRIGDWKRMYPHEAEQGLTPRVFRGPLVVVRETPRADADLALAMVSPSDLVYSSSFHGFSAAWHPEEAERVARYLAVFLNSNIALYALLLSSAGFGVERATLGLDELRALRLPEWEHLGTELQSEVDSAWESLRSSSKLDRHPADAVIGRIFGLSRVDLECVRDTLQIALPFERSFRRAQAPPSDDAGEREHFRARVKAILAPLLRRSGRTLHVRLGAEPVGSPWRALWISTVPQAELSVEEGAAMKEALSLAVSEGASRVVMPRPGLLVVAIFAQYRYWTPTQARALAMDILDDREWMRALRGGGR